MEPAREALAPFVRPREEVAEIRKILGANLSASLDNFERDGQAPLALLNTPNAIRITPDVRGLHRRYLEALNRNVNALQELEDLKERPGNSQTLSATDTDPQPSFLAEHMATLRLRRKETRLKAVLSALELLDQKPAASADFLQPSQVFRGLQSLPDVPNDVVSFALDKALSKTDLDGLIERLQKSVLRAKLLLRNEEHQLSFVRKRSPRPTKGAADHNRLAALTATRNELISWMESELASAAKGNPDDSVGQQPQFTHGVENGLRIEEQISAVKHKYGEYLAARKSLVGAASQGRRPVIGAPSAQTRISAASPGHMKPTRSSYLLAPYLERLLLAAPEQKGLILQKAHLNYSLAKQTKDTCQLLDHLAEESQLLPKYYAPGRSRPRPGTLRDALASQDGCDVTVRSRRWILASEAAKLATLETVAERTEEGEMALAACAQNLAQIDELIGRQSDQRDHEAESGGRSDLWPSQGQLVAEAAGVSKPHRRSKLLDKWSIIDGGLGLLRAEGENTLY